MCLHCISFSTTRLGRSLSLPYIMYAHCMVAIVCIFLCGCCLLCVRQALPAPIATPMCCFQPLPYPTSRVWSSKISCHLLERLACHDIRLTLRYDSMISGKTSWPEQIQTSLDDLLQPILTGRIPRGCALQWAQGSGAHIRRSI